MGEKFIRIGEQLVSLGEQEVRERFVVVLMKHLYAGEEFPEMRTKEHHA
jgi:hypothetical protein